MYLARSPFVSGLAALIVQLLASPAMSQPADIAGQHEIIPRQGLLLSNVAGFRRGGIDRYDPVESLMQQFLQRGRIIGDPRQLAVNLKHQGIYVLHGGDDDIVPVNQAQQMAELLGEMHHDWTYHEEPGQGHWWSNDLADGGATCMDWPDMYDCFARHALPPEQSVRSVDFATANPGVSSVCHWPRIVRATGRVSSERIALARPSIQVSACRVPHCRTPRTLAL